MSSNITVSGLAATSVAGGVKLAWSVTDPNADGLPYRSLAAVEVWAATTNDRSTATKIGEGQTDFFHNYLPVETFFYYWIKARDEEGSDGDWYPSGATSGVVGGTIGLAGLSFSLMGGKIATEVDTNGNLTVSIQTAAGETPSASNPVFVAFATSDGGYVIRQITSELALTISDYDQGVLSGYSIYVCVFDNDGTPVLALINCNVSLNGQITPLSLSKPASTTTTVERGSFVAESVITDKYYRIVGRLVWASIDSGWSPPDRIDLHSMDSKLPGDVVQEIVIETHSSGSITDTLIPLDNTIPQWTEGDNAVLDSLISITPTSIGNVMECEANVPVAFSTAGYVILALFRNSGADARAATLVYNSASGDINTMLLRRREIIPLTSEIDYEYRVGSDVNGTVYVCSLPSGDVLGARLRRRFVVREIMA